MQVAVGGATDGESHPEELWECWIADAAARVGDAAAGLILVDSLLFYYDDTDSTYTRVPLSILLQRAGVTAMNLRDRLEYTG
ncbi:MAG: hypothetical protein ACYSTY_09660, partial [Planctomycetota bacterium]